MRVFLIAVSGLLAVAAAFYFLQEQQGSAIVLMLAALLADQWAGNFIDDDTKGAI